MKSKVLIPLIIAVLLLAGCGSDYNLNFLPPASADLKEIFPEKIGDKACIPQKMDIGGIQCRYGDDKAIYAVRLKNQDDAIGFFKESVLPQFKELPNNFSGTVNGQFYASANSGSKYLFGWVNQNWAFLLTAMNKQALGDMVKNFKFIADK